MKIFFKREKEEKREKRKKRESVKRNTYLAKSELFVHLDQDSVRLASSRHLSILSSELFVCYILEKKNNGKRRAKFVL